ncbi:isocitrate lyase/phosphoenolpyruvate mutase family protein [Alicyclobacillus sp. SO9]|uniref:isocitrate lyase/PEP mutase family protein n=1 Tax=Alicyclobacillus sp. SO9 TaxID=2665646 RepID=UPI0018E81CF5|nr:isocitrate lyase/phosphoenolpyruvate mutase family protein [Alicyclobacillus sp. SO9]QQE80657.1 isocitrate lyase/phosphoenolpyruvate mutase family protein [Alicyclobacillus sp. SO9]
MKEQAVKAQLFRDLHYAASPLVLANAWDAVTARIFEAVGFPAIATTSAGMAMALGYPDGGYLPFEALVAALQRVVTSVQVPVSADIESGYGVTPEETADYVDKLIETGIVGINIEDSVGHGDGALFPEELQAQRIAAIHETCHIPLFINARIDNFKHGGKTDKELLEDAIRRAQLYRQAGADCIFVFGVRDLDVIQASVRRIPGPVNFMAGSGMPSVNQLKEAGASRISMGPAALKVAMGSVKKVATDLFSNGTYDSSPQSEMSYQELNGYFL